MVLPHCFVSSLMKCCSSILTTSDEAIRWKLGPARYGVLCLGRVISGVSSVRCRAVYIHSNLTSHIFEESNKFLNTFSLCCSWPSSTVTPTRCSFTESSAVLFCDLGMRLRFVQSVRSWLKIDNVDEFRSWVLMWIWWRLIKCAVNNRDSKGVRSCCSLVFWQF